jgi:hypothetical protein
VQIGRFAKTPIVHTVELLDWATGGPMPPALDGRRLREPAARIATATPDEIASTPTETDPNPTGIW